MNATVGLLVLAADDGSDRADVVAELQGAGGLETGDATGHFGLLACSSPARIRKKAARSGGLKGMCLRAGSGRP